MDILLNPLQHKSLIKKSHVQISTSFDFLASKEPPRTNAVVKINNNHIMITSFDQPGTVIVRSSIAVEPSALYVHEHRPRLGVVDGGVDVEEETVFRSAGRDIG
jgi:hypothetical protein